MVHGRERAEQHPVIQQQEDRRHAGQNSQAQRENADFQIVAEQKRRKPELLAGLIFATMRENVAQLVRGRARQADLSLVRRHAQRVRRQRVVRRRIVGQERPGKQDHRRGRMVTPGASDRPAKPLNHELERAGQCRLARRQINDAVRRRRQIVQIFREASVPRARCDLREMNRRAAIQRVEPGQFARLHGAHAFPRSRHQFF